MIYWETNLLFNSYCYLLVAISLESLSEISEKSEEMSEFWEKRGSFSEKRGRFLEKRGSFSVLSLISTFRLMRESLN